MSIAPKPLLAGTLIAGMTAVWVPRLTGYDPFGWLPEESLPAPSEPVPPFPDFPTEGQGAAGVDSPTDAVGVGSAGPANLPVGEAERDALSLGSLKEVVQFLERRGNARERVPVRAPEKARNEEPATETARTPAPFIDEALEVVSSSSSDSFLAPPTPREKLDDFLGDFPLHTIIRGNDLSTATFGNLRVTVGDSLTPDAFEVREITADGVRIETGDGPVWVRLPPTGADRYAPRPPAARSRSADTPDTPPEDPDTTN